MITRTRAITVHLHIVDDVLAITPEHMVALHTELCDVCYCSDIELVPAREIREGDKIYVSDGASTSIARVSAQPYTNTRARTHTHTHTHTNCRLSLQLAGDWSFFFSGIVTPLIRDWFAVALARKTPTSWTCVGRHTWQAR